MTANEDRTPLPARKNGILATPASERAFHLVAHGIFLAAAILAAWFYLERNTGDPGWRIFCVINRGNICPSHQRWILGLVQILPLMAVKAGLTLKQVLVLHALGPTLLFYLLYLYTGIRLKDRLAAMAIIWVSVLSLGPVYFHWSDLEMHLMGGMLITLYAMLFREGRRLPEHYVLLPFLVLFIITSHPMALAAFAFLVMWYVVDRRRADVYFFAVSALLIFLKFSGADRYEQTMTANLAEAWASSGEMLRNLADWLSALLIQNAFIWFMAAFVVYALWKGGRALAAGAVLVYLSAYLAVVVFLAPPAHHEPYLLPLVPVVVLLFLGLTRRILVGTQAGLALTAAVVVVSLVSVYQHRHWAVRKIALQQELIARAQQSDLRFALVTDGDLPAGSRDLLTGYYYPETMLLSALHGPDNTRAVLPAYLVRQSLQELRGFLPDSLLALHFTAGLQEFPDSVLPAYATTYFREPYMEGLFRLYFSDNLNDRYFTPYPVEFQWAEKLKNGRP